MAWTTGTKQPRSKHSQETEIDPIQVRNIIRSL